jgi:hypothetical protein
MFFFGGAHKKIDNIFKNTKSSELLFFAVCKIFAQRIIMKRRSLQRTQDADSHQTINDDGYASLHDFLWDYKRISIEDACELQVFDPRLYVWRYLDNNWVQMSDRETAQLWTPIAGNKTALRTLCDKLTSNLLQLQTNQYNTLRRAFTNTSSRDIVGLYRNGNNFAVVARAPRDLGHSGKIVSLGSASLGLAGVVGAAELPLYLDKKRKQLDRERKQKSQSDKQALILKELEETVVYEMDPKNECSDMDVLLKLEKIKNWFSKSDFLELWNDSRKK